MDWNTFFSFATRPAYQILLFLILTPVAIFIFRPENVDKAWVIALITFVVFLIVNAAFLWFSESYWQYFFYSIGLSIAYVVVLGFIMPGLFKIMRLEGSGESSMAFLVLIYQPFALLMVMLVKWIVMKWF